MRLTTPSAIEISRTISGVLAYRDDEVEIEGVVRWRREAGSDSDDPSQLPFWEVGVAFTRIGEVDAAGIWRRLEVHRRGPTPEPE